MNNIHKHVIKTADAIINTFVMIVLCIVVLYSVYSIWDNNQVYAEVDVVQSEMMKLKPEPDDPGPSFEELRAINPDVCAWVTMDNTEIDYPILQGDDDLTYINTDVYGNFALAGSIFLDVRNNPDFTDAYSLIYGHHMANSKMFGDLDLYKEADFFEENTTGMLLLPDRVYHLEVLSCLVVNSRDDVIFEPQKWLTDASGVLNYAGRNSLHLHEGFLNKLKQQEDVQILALSTCSSEYDEARTIVLAVMEPYIEE